MDKVRDVLSFVWKYRFWFCLGIVLILAIVVYPTGTQRVQAQAKTRASELDNAYQSVQKYASGAYPNTTWASSAEQKEKELGKVVTDVWADLYNQQKDAFTWPKEVAEHFAKLAFGDPLDFERGRHLIRYRREGYDTQIEPIWMLLDPLTVDDKGEVKGKVDTNWQIVQPVQWDHMPTTNEAWLAQEDLWVRREIIRVVAEVNKPATGWRDAAVRTLLEIAIGRPALDTRTKAQLFAESKDLVSPFPESAAGTDPTAAAAFGGRGRSTVRLDPVRYLENTEQYRVLPVKVSAFVDQMKITEVLGALSNSRLRYTIVQAGFGTPAGTKKVELPKLLQENQVASAVEDEAVYNTVQLDVWGHMRIYKMPPSMKPTATADAAKDSAQPPAPADAKAETKPVAKAAAEVKAPAAPRVETKPEPPVAPKAEPKAEPKPEPKSDSKAEPKAEAKPKVEAEPKTKPEPKAEPKAAPSPAPKTEAPAKPQSETPTPKPAPEKPATPPAASETKKS
jgi:type II secretory pathway pseudopilin PulG